MLSLREFWKRHRRKFLIGTGVIGGGYLLYRLYGAHRNRLADLEKVLAERRKYDEFVKAQMQAHFESIQQIADTTSLPHAMRYLRDRIEEELNLVCLTERLQEGKNTLSREEKLEIWQRLKVLSFTKMVLSLWAVTMLSLYIRVQVNILGRHLYIDTACGVEASYLLEDADLSEGDDLRKFLASADYLAGHGLAALISDLHIVAAEVLNGKQLTDSFNSTMLHETAMQILERFMSGSAHHWVDYLMPGDPLSNLLTTTSNSENKVSSNRTEFEQLMEETRAVLLGAEFGNVMGLSLKSVLGAVTENTLPGEGDFIAEMQLAKLLPRLGQMIPLLLDEPPNNRFIRLIRTMPEVNVFFTLLYTEMSLN